MGKDLLDDRFGRFRELPLGLARLGHDVKGIALGYHRKEEETVIDADSSGNGRVHWLSIGAHGLVPRLSRFVARSTQFARDFKPDVIWACSDAYHVIYGVWLAHHTRAKCVIDLYDNFEAFGATKVPGVLSLFRHCVKTADGATCFSKRLADHIAGKYPRSKPTAVVESAVRKELFYPQIQTECRRRLGLPRNARIVGTAGALDSSRGIETLFQGFELLASRHADIHLAVAGPRNRRVQIPTGARMHDLGVLDYEAVPTFINALDLSIICYRHSPQGEYSFPQKAYEILACRAPLIAAAVGSMNELLAEYPQCLYEPESPASLAEAIQRQLDARTIVDVAIPSWSDSAKELETFLAAILRGSSAPQGCQSSPGSPNHSRRATTSLNTDS
jgi:glycosyltransferase involved in cell wall biosynthesis